FRSLASESISTQVDVIRKLGFSGVYVDTRGYRDNGKEVISQLTTVLGYGPTLTHASAAAVFFPVGGGREELSIGRDPYVIMHDVGYIADQLGKRYDAVLSEGIDFRRVDWPSFIRRARGLSKAEEWGRWSDARVAKSVRLDFFDPLPAHFVLTMELRAFGPNGGRTLGVRVGDQLYAVTLPKNQGSVSVPVENESGADFI